MSPPLPVAPDTSPPPLGRATPYARDGGTRGHATPPFPIHAEGGARGHAAHPHPHRSRPLPFGHAALACDTDVHAAALRHRRWGLDCDTNIAPRHYDTDTARWAFDTDENLPQTSNTFRLRGGYEQLLKNDPFVVKFAGMAGCSHMVNNNADINGATAADIDNPFAPFTSKMEWEIARWAKLRGPGSTAFTELTSIEGVAKKLGLSFKNMRELDRIIDKKLPGHPLFQRHEVMAGSKVCKVYYRDVIECIKSLFGDPNFALYLHFAPEKHYTNDTEDTQMYHDMHTGKWWWSTQVALEQERLGATIVPVLLLMDKTLLTMFRNKSAYPLYMTIGNILKEIRRKPSMRAYILLAYLLATHLYHVILALLETAGTTRVYMARSDGHLHQIHPLFAAFIGDYPEQILSTGSISGRCPTCDVDHNRLGDYDSRDTNHLWDLCSILDIVDSFQQDPAGFLRACDSAGMKPIVDPFWKDLPYAHIFRSITPDILHQIYQGIVKHVIRWITKVVGVAEESLTHVTGQEHNQMCRILLALVMDIPLTGGLSNACLVRATQALMDFVFIAQYPIHTGEMLQLLEDTLSRFHESKSIFVDLGIRRHFNIPKFHFASHYVDLIKLYRTTDNFNTKTTERLHIDLAKDVYAATNHKDKFSQMTTWLERKEKIYQHNHLVRWQLEGPPPIVAAPRKWLPPGLKLDCKLHMSKHPSIQSVSLDTIETEYGASHFRVALRQYVRALWDVHFPFRHLPVWHRIKYLRTELYTGQIETADSIHAQPQKSDTHGCPQAVPSQFDTALINDGTGGDVGVIGHRIGRVRVIFSLPEKSQTLFPMGKAIPNHLVYVEWYTGFTQDADTDSFLFKISPMKDRVGSGRICSIIPVANIRRSVHLIPKFGAVAPQAL
ncbi:hypothetical protein EDB84DRAFT_1590846 [Lactarius hengduanensis]|nr:hypothetical protein EDB84DRAFT_1590846 [Lactarius hengduanensis]